MELGHILPALRGSAVRPSFLNVTGILYVPLSGFSPDLFNNKIYY
jgi:hypothetical protein